MKCNLTVSSRYERRSTSPEYRPLFVHSLTSDRTCTLGGRYMSVYYKTNITVRPGSETCIKTPETVASSALLESSRIHHTTYNHSVMAGSPTCTQGFNFSSPSIQNTYTRYNIIQKESDNRCVSNLDNVWQYDSAKLPLSKLYFSTFVWTVMLTLTTVTVLVGKET